MDKLYHWSARRSGGRITITAVDSTGHPVKVPNVDKIEVRDGGPASQGIQTRVIATDKDGDEYELRPETVTVTATVAA